MKQSDHGHTGQTNLFSSVFQLGQHFLILAEENETELNNRLAVNWLIKAAKQGRKGAARILQRCWIQRKGSRYRIQCLCVHVCAFVFAVPKTAPFSVDPLTGITPENEADMRKLSTESKFELAVRKAAMMMYWKLNPERKKKVAVAEMLENVSQVNGVQGRVHTHTHTHTHTSTPF